MEVFAVLRFDLFAILITILVFAESKIYRTAQETVRFAAIVSSNYQIIITYKR